MFVPKTCVSPQEPKNDYLERTNLTRRLGDYLERTNLTRRLGPRYMNSVPVSMGILMTSSLLVGAFGAGRGFGGNTISSIPLNNPSAFPELRVAARVV